jgi:hypothetical protein
MQSITRRTKNEDTTSVKKVCATARTVGILLRPKSATWWLPFVPYCAIVYLYVILSDDLETRMIEGEDHSLVPIYER